MDSFLLIWLERRAFAVFLLWLAVQFVPTVQAQTPLSQMYHRGWTVQDGAPNNIEDAIQGPDGFIWITTDDGVFRFDGVTFERYRPPAGTALISDRMNSVSVTPDGSLWLAYMLGGVTRIKGNQLTNFTEKDGLRSGHIGAISQDKDGRTWIIGSRGLQFIRGNHVTQFHGAHGEGDIYGESVTVDRDGNVWMAQGANTIRVLERGSDQLNVAFRGPYAGCVKAHDGGVICWPYKISDPVLHLAVSHGKVSSGRLATGTSGIFDLLAARDGTIWMGTEKDGIERFDAESNKLARNSRIKIDVFGHKDGLTGKRASTIFEDREGSVWVAGDKGLDQFRMVPVHQVTLDAFLTTLPTNGIWPHFIIGTRRLVDVTSDTYSPLTREFESGHQPRAEFRGDDGTIWVGGTDGLWRYVNRQFSRVALPVDLQGIDRIIQTVVEDSSHGIWVTISNNGLYRLKDGLWARRGGYVGLPDKTAYAALRDGRGELWFGFLKNVLARVSSGRVTVFGSSDGLSIGDIRTLNERDGSIWIGGEHGVVVYNNGKFEPLRLREAELVRGVTGLVFLPNGDLWVNAASGAYQVKHDELVAWESDRMHAVRWRKLDYLDGLDGIPNPLLGNPSAAASPDGRLYFGMNGALEWIDPNRLPTNPIPPPVWITDVRTLDEDFVPGEQTLRLEPNVRNLEISYSAPSLLIPERVRFRYRLQGFDSAWVEAGSRRKAIYSKLPPGTYTFQAIACNDSGVWNRSGASILLTVKPTFSQTIWLRLCIIVALSVLFFLYFRIRLNRTKQRIANRMYEILGERQRIARDLHDTLLQSVQALMFKVGVAARKLPVDDPVRPLLEATLVQSDQVLMEGRKLISSLQTKEEPSEALLDSLRVIGESLRHTYPSTEFFVDVRGSERILSTVVNPELCTIGREALTNAFQHANAAHVWLELNATPEELRLKVRDDGNGIDAQILARGYRDEHWGLRNMKARSERLGGRFTLNSSLGAGTTVEVAVPAFVAYKDAPGGLRERFRRLFR
ncbi:Histidine kinase [Bryocella elongata]|uniref:Histidine kinase n=1 Tax=Bryocella elongata TaxID=863522 RepID=A0A1H6BRR7_9BACT|nr:sensor histidine kinase [Bryocella elongata]SEG63373.1 Histidine kinase [Bryocella elongata]